MEDKGRGELQVAPKLFPSHSKLFKGWQLCFFGGTQRVGEEGGGGRVGMEEVGSTRTNCH